MDKDIELYLIRASFNSYAPLVAEIEDEEKQDELVEKFLSVLYHTLEELRPLEQTKSEWVNNCASLYRQERNKRFNL